jgi:SAM-dependent methyltransferase
MTNDAPATTPPCRLCGCETMPRTAYGRPFAECVQCSFVFAYGPSAPAADRGMGMLGSWSGPGGGGYREYFLVQMLRRDLGGRKFLLYGTGNTPTLENLLKDGVDVVGSDISRDVVGFKKRAHGEDRFFTPDLLPAADRYDAIVAVEVFEHFSDPRRNIELLVQRLAPGGVIAGTTDFYRDGRLVDDSEPGYLRSAGHVAYWSEKSLGRLAASFGLALALFELVRPGSVLPDEKFGKIWINKRVFFLFDPSRHQDYFTTLRHTTPILPIDNP